MRAREIGAASSRSAKAPARLPAPSITVQGITTCWWWARPLHVGHGDAAVGARGDGLVHLGIAEGRT